MHVGENGCWHRCAPSPGGWPELWAGDKTRRDMQQFGRYTGYFSFLSFKRGIILTM